MKWLIFLLTLLLPINAMATEYHVASDGTGDYLTIAEANAVAVAGDTIALKCGNTFREQLTPVSGSISAGYTTYTSYGTGEKPLLLGSVNRYNAADWTDLGGNIWQTGTIGAVTIGSELLSNPSFETNTTGWSLYANGATGTDCTGSGRTTTVGEFDSGSAGYKLVCVNNGASSSDIQWSVAGLSITSGQWYKLTFKVKTTSAFSVSSVKLMQTNSPWATYYSTSSSQTVSITTDWQTFTIYYKANITAIDGRITWYLGNLIPDGATMYFDTVSFMNCENPDLLSVDVGNIIFNNEASCGVKKQTEGAVTSQGDFWYDFTNDLVKIYSTSNPASYYTNIELALAGNIITGSPNYVIFDGLDLRYGAGHGFGFSSNHDVTIRNCYISYIGGGDQYGNYTVRLGNGIEFWNGSHDCIVEKNYISQCYDAALTNQGTGTLLQQYNMYWRNNILVNNEYTFEIWLSDSTSNLHDIYFENNICINAGSWSHNQRWDGPRAVHLSLYSNTAITSNVFFRNNIFYGSLQYGVIYQSSNDLSDYTLDNNLWYGAVTANWRVDSTNYTTLSAWQSATGQDLHSISADPLLNSDYTLKRGSPCINAGIDVGVRDDYLGNPRPDLGEGNCDIGAFEMREREIAMNYIKGDTGRIIHGDKIIRHSSLYRTKYT